MMICQCALNSNIVIADNLFQKMPLPDEIPLQNHYLTHVPYIYIYMYTYVCINCCLTVEPRYLEQFCHQTRLQTFATAFGDKIALSTWVQQ